MAKQTSQINIAFLTKGEGEVAKAFKDFVVKQQD